MLHSYSLVLLILFTSSGYRFWLSEFEPYQRQDRIVARFKEKYLAYILDTQNTVRFGEEDFAESLYERFYNKNREKITVLAIRGKGNILEPEPAELSKADMRELMRMPFLDSAAFSNCGLPHDELFRFLFRLAPRLRIMEFFKTDLDDTVLDRLPEMPTLARLELSGNDLSGDAVSRFLEKCPNVDCLTLRPKEYATYRAEILKKVGLLKKLRILRFERFDAPTIEDLEALAGLPKLISVSTDDCKLTGEGFERLCRLETVTELLVTDARLSEDDLVHLKSAKNRLRFLGLSGNDITGEGLAGLEEMPQLCSLSLSRTRVTDETLARLPECPLLDNLFLSESAVTDTGLKHLGRFPKLRHLIVSKTAVTDAGFETLEKIPSLKYVTADGSKMSRERIEEFNKSRR